jgi:hypothetical protein
MVGSKLHVYRLASRSFCCAPTGRTAAYWCHATGTKVGFTFNRKQANLPVSSSGGGLFGRPVTYKSGALLIFGDFLAAFESLNRQGVIVETSLLQG